MDFNASQLAKTSWAFAKSGGAPWDGESADSEDSEDCKARQTLVIFVKECKVGGGFWDVLGLVFEC